MVEQRRPGWYDDGGGQIRWWSGKGWTTHTQPRAEVDTTPPTVPNAPARTADVGELVSRPRPTGAKRGYRGKTLLVTAGAAAVVGMFIGIGAGSHDGAPAVDPTTAPAYLALQTRFIATSAERDALKSAAADVASKAADAADAQAAVDATRDDLDARESALDEREAKLDKKAKSLTRAAAASASTAKPKVAAAPVSVYYQNCDAARAAGAAPVRRGDPGYASHLDRDGDGVGCE